MYPFEEAWFYAEMDSNFWLINHVEGCTELINPNPDQTFGCVYELYSCSRYAHFPTTYYIEEKRDENLALWLFNEEDDPIEGDPDYDIDVLYVYQSETIPVSTPGYPLP